VLSFGAGGVRCCLLRASGLKQTFARKSGGALPTVEHEGLVAVCRNRKSLLPELLQMLGTEVPAYSKVDIEDSNLTEIKPVELEVDVVSLLANEKPVLCIVGEVQRAIDTDKEYTWPAYAMLARKRYRCPVCLMVLATTKSVAKWARQAIDLGTVGTFQATVLGPNDVPVVDDVEQAKANPELAVVSAIMHGHGDVGFALRVARAACEAAAHVGGDQGNVYLVVITNALGPAALMELEREMTIEPQEIRSEFVRNFLAQCEAREARGRAEGKATALLLLLETKGCAVTARQRKQITSCSDLHVLDRWLRKVLTTDNVEELLDDNSRMS